METRLQNHKQCGKIRFFMTAFEKRAVIRSVQALFAHLLLSHVVQAIRRTYDLERVYGLYDRDIRGLENRKDGRRKLMVDHMQVGNVWPSVPD